MFGPPVTLVLNYDQLTNYNNLLYCRQLVVLIYSLDITPWCPLLTINLLKTLQDHIYPLLMYFIIIFQGKHWVIARHTTTCMTKKCQVEIMTHFCSTGFFNTCNTTKTNTKDKITKYNASLFKPKVPDYN